MNAFCSKTAESGDNHSWINQVTAYSFEYIGFILIIAFFTNIFEYHADVLHYILLSAILYGVYVMINHLFVKKYVSIKTILKFEILLLIAMSNILMGLLFK